MDYDIVSALTVTDLCRLVNEKIGEGWIPCGGVGVGGKLYQAMTRYHVFPNGGTIGITPPLPPAYIAETSPALTTGVTGSDVALNVINARMLAR